MLYGLYLSSQGAEIQSFRQDVIANNLANAGTNAFKRDMALFQAHEPFDVANGQPLLDEMADSTGGTSVASVVTDYSNGSVMPTGAQYDVALVGPGFMRVSDGNQEYLTRNGSLTIDSTGRIVTQDQGLAVQGLQAVPPTATGIEISTEGNVSALNPGGERIYLGQFDLVEPEAYGELRKVGNSLYVTDGEVQAADPALQIRQGWLESSGVEPVSEMMQLIEASRAFEANVNMIKYQDEALGRLLQAMPIRR